MNTAKQNELKFRLKYVLTVPFICLISLSVLFSSYLTWKYNEETTAKLGIKITKQSAYMVQKQLEFYLSSAHVSNQSLKHVINYGLIDINDRSATLKYMTHVVKENPNIGTLSVAYPDGSYMGLSNDKAGDILKKLAGLDTERVFYTYRLEDDSVIYKKPNYDARLRPWFKEALSSDSPIWSSIYEMFSSDDLGITFSEALYKDDKFLGVIGTDVVFDDLSTQLATMTLTDNSYLFIVDDKEQIVAQTCSKVLNADPYERPSTCLFTISESNNNVLKQIYQHIMEKRVDPKDPYYSYTSFNIRGESKKFFINYIPYSNAKGMDWHIGVVLPQQDLLGNINKIRTNTLLIWSVSFLLSITLGLCITYMVTNSINRLRDKIGKVKKDGFYEHSRHKIVEINDLSLAFSDMSKRLTHSRIESNTDSLTNLANRRSFDESLAEFWTKFQTNEITDIILISFDIDYFKLFNDTYGHPVGDDCLRRFGKIISDSTASLGLAARVGGEEFTIILPDNTLDTATKLADKIRYNLAQENIPHSSSVVASYVTISMGVVSANLHGAQTKEELLSQADGALYTAKRAGKDRYVVYSLDDTL